MKWYFTKILGKYVYWSNGKEVYRTENLAIAYADTGPDVVMRYTLHKHGESKAIEDWLFNAQTKLLSAGDEISTGMAKELKLLKDPGWWTTDLLTEVINCTGSLDRLMEKKVR